MNSPETSPIHIEGHLGEGNRAIFLDRDGVINEDRGYVGSWDQFKFLDGAIEGVKSLNLLGYRVIIVTNQSGIARGYYSHDQFIELTIKMLEEFMNHGSRVDAVYACPHHPSKQTNRCNCRKPLPGLILEAISRYELSAEHSFLVGDKESDISAAKAAGIHKTALVRNSATNYKETNSAARWYVEDLIEFSNVIKKIHDC